MHDKHLVLMDLHNHSGAKKKYKEQKRGKFCFFLVLFLKAFFVQTEYYDNKNMIMIGTGRAQHDIDFLFWLVSV